MDQLPGIVIKYPSSTLDEESGLKDSAIQSMVSLCHYTSTARRLIDNTQSARGSLTDRVSRTKHVLFQDDGKICLNIRNDKLTEDNNFISSSIGFVLIFKEDKALDPEQYSDANIIEHRNAVTFGSSHTHTGFEDKRFVRYMGRNIIFANAFLENGHRRMFQYDCVDNICKQITVSDFPLNDTEKNWAPFVKDGVLHLIYSINPLVVFRECLPLSGDYVVAHAGSSEGNIRSDYPWGSTPLIPWISDYFVGFAHSRMPWRSVPLALDTERWKVAFGSPVQFEQPAEAVPWRGKSVQFPYHLEIKGSEPILYVECEDRHSVAYSLDIPMFCEEMSRLIARLNGSRTAL